MGYSDQIIPTVGDIVTARQIVVFSGKISGKRKRYVWLSDLPTNYDQGSSIYLKTPHQKYFSSLEIGTVINIDGLSLSTISICVLCDCGIGWAHSTNFSVIR